MTATSSLPNIAELIGPVLQRVAFEQRPLLIAAAERLAATRYRGWANQVADAKVKHSLLACADREDDIAKRIEGLFPNAESLQKELLSRTPELAEVGGSIFSPYSLQDQFTLQARGERVGAATWRAYAARATDTNTQEVFLRCAVLEEESALFLESLAGKQY
jgi:hypothetical protein